MDPERERNGSEIGTRMRAVVHDTTIRLAKKRRQYLPPLAAGNGSIILLLAGSYLAVFLGIISSIIAV